MANQQQSNPSDGGQQGQQPQFQQDLQPKWVRLLWFAVLLMAVLYVTQTLFNPQVNTIPYSQFKNKVRQGEVAEVTMQGHQITGRYKSGGGEAADNRRRGPGKAMPFETIAPSMQDPELIDLLEKKDVTIHAKSTKQSWFVNLLIAILPWVVIIGAFFYFSKKFQDRMGGGPGGGIFGFGKSKAKQFEKSMSDIQFEDVAGLENTKKELQEIIGFLKNPDQYRSLGGKLPKGVLLVGPPGTGKTLMARAVAGEADVPFFSISGSEFIEMFVGVGASRVRDMFDNAKKESPAIIFIDEIDSIGRVRGTGVGGGHDEREQTLNQILNEMDGFSPQESVVVMAATNRPDVLDPALTRPGRFDRQVTLELPQKNARISILKVHTKHVTVGDDVALEVVANRTVGFSGAELQNLVNEAALLAARKGKEKVEAEDFDQARDKILMGIEREDLINEEEKEVIAYHESGHAMMSMLLPGADPLEKVTIIPRGRALGATEQIPEEDRFNLTRGYLLDRITVMLGGRAAEQVQFSDSTTGAGDDLQKATEIARRMVTQWGMSDKVGSVAFQYGSSHPFLGRELGSQKDFSEETAKIIDDEVRRLVSECLSKAIDVLNNHKQELDSLAQALLDRETLSKNEVKEIIGKSHAKTAPAEN
ncbi:MAG: ATP-dependent zinc metalloprotease FtsH [Desulfobacterales bacterium]|nr:ATP-dependent zinc metalloprotease FtsH [Desulfobacterales bacterium]